MPEFGDSRFQWDETKSRRTFRTRGFDFAFAVRIFDQPFVEAYQESSSGEEDRSVCIGMVDGICTVVVCTMRGSERRVISAWRAGKREVDEFATQIGSLGEG